MNNQEIEAIKEMIRTGYYEGVIYPCGIVYKGGLYRNQFNGRGRLILPNGKIYEYEFDKGYLSGGRQLLISPDGFYEGEVLNNQPHGKGIMRKLDGEIYHEGEWNHGQIGLASPNRGLLHELIDESRSQIPSKAKRIRMQNNFKEDDYYGAYGDPDICKNTIELLQDLYTKIDNLFPNCQEDRIEKIRWKHDIRISVLNIIISLEESKSVKRAALKNIVGILFSLFTGGAIHSLLPSDINKLWKTKDLNDITNEIHAETRKELASIGVYYWPS